MPVLSETDRLRVWRGLMRHWSTLREAVGAMSKAGLRAAVDATDQWIDDNQASYNAALPEAARTALTQVQKTLLFCAVAAMRVSIAFCRRLLGGVD